MSKEPKNIKTITWPNGRTTDVTRRNDGYHWTTAEGNHAISSHWSNLKIIATEDGGVISSRPNEFYDPNAKTKTSIPWLRF